MAEINIKVSELSDLTGIHRVTLSRLKNSDYPAQVSLDSLYRLCSGLTLAYRDKYQLTGEERFNKSITPNDLLEVVPD